MRYTPKLAIVDNDRFTRRAMKQVLEEDGGFEVIWNRSDSLAAEHLIMHAETRPQLLLLDMSLDDRDGAEVCRSIRRRSAGLFILGVTAFPPQQYAERLAEAGAQGLVTKESDSQLIAAVRAVLSGHMYCPDAPYARFHAPSEAYAILHAPVNASESLEADQPLAGELTVREREVLESYERTGSYKATAKQLGIEGSTARNLMARARKRLGANSTIEAISTWHERDMHKAGKR